MMICLGDQGLSPQPLESEAAQLRITEWFRADFQRRFPTGIVISELEYMGRTKAAPDQPGPLQYPGRPALNRIMQALSADFRRWLRDRDYRKCDILGISGDGATAELIEVTTASNAVSAINQLRAKLGTLQQTVNRVHDLRVEWRPSRWRPTDEQMFYVLPPLKLGEVRFLCYQPTYRLAASDGVVLYELHVIERPTVPVPVPIPQEASEGMRDVSQRRQLSRANAEAWARQFLQEHPTLTTILQILVVVVGVVMLVVALIALFDPVPGDEAAAAPAAMARIKHAAGR
jgi:hypothetical protein